jgi:biopolymer transport protein ExbD
VIAYRRNKIGAEKAMSNHGHAGETGSVHEHHERPALRYQPNLTPLIDVLFLLLLFLLLGTQFRWQEGQLDANLPYGDRDGPGTVLRLNVYAVGEDAMGGQFEVGSDQQIITDPGKLYARLWERKIMGGGTMVQIATRGPVRWEWVVEAFNQVRRAGFEKIGFAPVGT